MLCLSVVISGVYLQEELDSPLDRQRLLPSRKHKNGERSFLVDKLFYIDIYEYQANATVKMPADFPQSTQTLRDNIPRIAISCAGWFTLFFFMGWISRLLIPGVR